MQEFVDGPQKEQMVIHGLVHKSGMDILDFGHGQCRVIQLPALQRPAFTDSAFRLFPGRIRQNQIVFFHEAATLEEERAQDSRGDNQKNTGAKPAGGRLARVGVA